MEILGYIGLVITALSGVGILLKITGVMKSPPIEGMIATFIIGQSFFNGYVMTDLHNLDNLAKDIIDLAKEVSALKSSP